MVKIRSANLRAQSELNMRSMESPCSFQMMIASRSFQYSYHVSNTTTKWMSRIHRWKSHPKITKRDGRVSHESRILSNTRSVFSLLQWFDSTLEKNRWLNRFKQYTDKQIIVQEKVPGYSSRRSSLVLQNSLTVHLRRPKFWEDQEIASKITKVQVNMKSKVFRNPSKSIVEFPKF